MRGRWPETIAREDTPGQRYPLRIATPAGEARFWRSRFHHVNDHDREQPKIRQRSAKGWLHLDGERAAFLQTEEYHLASGTVWEEWFFVADCHSEQDGNAVQAMRAYWSGQFVSPSDYGTVLFCSAAWISPARRSRLSYRATFDAVVEALAPEHAIAVLIAYPQDDDEDAERFDQLGGWDSRQRALMRFYARELDFEAFPPSNAQYGFMWRAKNREVADYIRTDDEPRPAG